MDITIAQKDLARLLVKAVAMTSDKPKKPIMACVILDAKNNLLLAKAADDDITMSVTTRTSCEVSKPGIVAVNAKDLYARVQLHAAGPVRLVERAGKLELHGIGTKRKHVLTTALVDDYPALPDPTKSSAPVRVVSRSLARMLSYVEYAMCDDSARPNVNGAAIEFDGKWMHVIALDGRVMAHIGSEFASAAPMKLLVQRQAAIQLRKIIEASRTDIESSNTDIEVGDSNMFFTIAATRLSVKRMSVEFPDWRMVLSGCNHPASVDVGRAKLIDMVRSADVAAKENFIMLDFAPTSLRVWAESDTGESSDDVPVTYDGKTFPLGLTSKPILDVLNALESDSVRLFVGLSNDPGLDPLIIRPITDKTDEVFDGLIMPRRV